MKELEEELSEINIPCKPHEDVVDEFHADGILNHRRTRITAQHLDLQLPHRA